MLGVEETVFLGEVAVQFQKVLGMDIQVALEDEVHYI